MLAITLTAGDRPAYLREVLDALRLCDGIADTILLPHVEPGNDEVRALIEAIDFAPCEPTWNQERLGVNRNTHDALADGFSRAPFVLHLEDDTVPARDCLTYFRYVGKRYAADSSVFTATAYNRLGSLPPRNTWHAIQRRVWLHPWAWATWRNRWESMAASALWHATDLTWDCRVNEIVKRTGLHEVYPVLSRVQNIGLTSSVYSNAPPPSWYKKMHYLKHWAGCVSVPHGEFAELRRPSVAELGVSDARA